MLLRYVIPGFIASFLVGYVLYLFRVARRYDDYHDELTAWGERLRRRERALEVAEGYNTMLESVVTSGPCQNETGMRFLIGEVETVSTVWGKN